MALLFKTALLLMTVLHSAVVMAWIKPPAFCNGIDCPQFTTICSNSKFEIRNYPVAEWVSISFEGPGTSDFDSATQHGFDALFDYITGANAAGAKIDMTAPVKTRVIPGRGPNCNTTFTVSFFVPFKYQGKAPAPTNPLVSLTQSTTNLTVAVGSFGGYVLGWQETIAPQLLALGLSLTAAGIEFNQTVEWTAGYNDPFTIFNRHNEVWYPVVGDKFSC